MNMSISWRFVAALAVSSVLGALCGAMTSVATYEEITEMNLQAIADSIIGFETNNGATVQSAEDIVSMKIAKRRHLRDSWGNPIEFIRLKDGGFRLSSGGDPAAAEKCPGIKQSIFIEEVRYSRTGTKLQSGETAQTR